MSFGSFLVFAILIFVVLFFIRRFLRRFKVCSISSVALVDGGVKTFKTGFTIYLGVKEYKRALRHVKFMNFWRNIFNKPLEELPLLYSNIPLTIPHVRVTKDILLGKQRVRRKSVLILDDASLVADSMLFKDKDLNDRLLYFNKLWGHMSQGGHLIYNTQSLSDMHYSVKRCISEYFYIHHTNWNWPFFIIAYVLECRYSEDGSVTFAQNGDISDNLKKVLIPKRYAKYYDKYCYSILTDSLPVADKVEKNVSSLKCDNIVTFRESSVLEEKEKEVKNNVENNKVL